MMKFKANTVYVAKDLTTGKNTEILAVDPNSEVVYLIQKGRVKQRLLREFKNYKQHRPLAEKEKHFLKTFA